MGVYDIYGKLGVQLKVGPREMTDYSVYSVGDSVPIADGVYVGYEGVVIAQDRVLIAEFDRLIDKWGQLISLTDVLMPDKGYTSLVEALEEVWKDD